MTKPVGITVCVNFSDFLEETLPRNRNEFDRMIVVTSPDDVATQEVCWKCRATCLSLFEPGKNFNKGVAINLGISAAPKTGWLCHIDADIVLPPGIFERSEEHMRKAPSRAILGCHRKMCYSRADWESFLQGNTSVLRPELDWKNRPVKRNGKNAVPVGYFQLWRANTGIMYPTEFETAATSDLHFGRLFAPRIFLEEWAIHLGSVPHERGLDWNGRKTPPWK